MKRLWFFAFCMAAIFITACGTSSPYEKSIEVFHDEGIVCVSHHDLSSDGTHINISTRGEFSSCVRPRAKQARIDIYEDRIVISSTYTLIVQSGPCQADDAGGGLIEFEILPGDLELREYPIVFGEQVIGVITVPLPDGFYKCFDTMQLDENLPILSPLYIESPLVLPSD